jgi:protein PhnA
MQTENKCPKCKSENIYQDGNLWICPECAHEWSAFAKKEEDSAILPHDSSIKDSNGVILSNGDNVVVIKDLKIKGSSSVVKGGTKVRNLRLSDGGDGHDIACKIDGLGSINLKSEFVKKV